MMRRSVQLRLGFGLSALAVFLVAGLAVAAGAAAVAGAAAAGAAVVAGGAESDTAGGRSEYFGASVAGVGSLTCAVVADVGVVSGAGA